MLLNINDPIQVHLLVDAALSESKEFEILSPEEVDDLKKLCRSLNQRIDQARNNLAIQSKYRDAAISMAKLYSSSDKKKGTDSTDGRPKRRSLLGHRSSNSDTVKDADIERLTSERKCEELAQELWNLEKRLMEPQKRLLQHTAGILQMTHKGPATASKAKGISQHGIPGSPESMYTYTNARSSIEPTIEEDLFDERSLYKMFGADGTSGSGQRDSWDLHGSTFSTSTGPSREQASEHMKTIAATEQKLESLNNRLREVIIKVNPQRQSFSLPPRAHANDVNATPGKLLPSHLEYLELGISAIDSEESHSKAARQESDLVMEEMVEEANRRIRALLLPFDSDRPLTPSLSGRSLKDQLIYFEKSIDSIENEFQRVKTLETQQVNLDQYEAVLMGLWDIIQSGTRGGENNPAEPFSLPNFSAKVQRMFTEVTNLKDQKNVLQTQIKQQRELNNKEESAKDAQLSQLEGDLARTQQSHEVAKKEVKDMQAQLAAAMEKLDEARRQSAQRGLEKESAAVQALEDKLSQRNDEIIKLEEELQDMKDEQGMRNAEVQSRLADAGSKVEALQSQLAKAEEEVTKKEAELDASNMEIARLQTEVTIARAELDGAYGSRAQRAAEVAANPVIQAEIDSLTTRNRTLQAELDSLSANSSSNGAIAELKRELSETIEEYEVMTKASIEWEKEREMLEEQVDKLRDEREALETRLADEQVRLLGMGLKSPGGNGGESGGGQGLGAGATSTRVLKDEFKRMMRDMRAENAKALKVGLFPLMFGWAE
jgi:DNA repair exonuclease SbcCD ATPase subunit